MPRRGPYSSQYSEQARMRLGAAVEEARRALGCETRPQFVKVSGVRIRSLEKVELGEPGVGPVVFNRLYRALPGWGPNTVRDILEGGEVPPVPAGPRSRLDVQWHTRDEISALLDTGADAETVLRKLMQWHRRFKEAGLTGDDLLTVSGEALKDR